MVIEGLLYKSHIQVVRHQQTASGIPIQQLLKNKLGYYSVQHITGLLSPPIKAACGAAAASTE